MRLTSSLHASSTAESRVEQRYQAPWHAERLETMSRSLKAALAAEETAEVEVVEGSSSSSC